MLSIIFVNVIYNIFQCFVPLTYRLKKKQDSDSLSWRLSCTIYFLGFLHQGTLLVHSQRNAIEPSHPSGIFQLMPGIARLSTSPVRPWTYYNEHFMPLCITDSNLLKSITSLLNARSYISIQIFNFIMLNLFALISVNTI